MSNIADIRKDYRLRSFSERDAAATPFEQFKQWWEEALASNIDEPNAMTLATADATGSPSARIVLLKGVTEEGFEFFTNYESHKAKDVVQNVRVSLVFFWKELERQIRINGNAVKTTEAVSDEYFKSRPFESRIGAWASPQSEEIESRDGLEQRVDELREQYRDREVPRPPFWGGYLVKPVMMEFWQGRPNRLHDRIEYKLTKGSWKKRRLAP
ncbi:MAG: pyridoxamine 5'-phosphate oxidase [Ferruginibacter sp.]